MVVAAGALIYWGRDQVMIGDDLFYAQRLSENSLVTESFNPGSSRACLRERDLVRSRSIPRGASARYSGRTRIAKKSKRS
jgi:hypothetical protein